MEKEEVSFRMCDWDNLKCRTCIYSLINGKTSKSCAKYRDKPDEVYYDGEDCPKYKQHLE